MNHKNYDIAPSTSKVKAKYKVANLNRKSQMRPPWFAGTAMTF